MGAYTGLGVLLTGATGGFGVAVSNMLAAQGAKLLLTDLDQGKLDDLARGLECETICIAGDVCDPALHERLVKTAEDAWGGVDVAINNAGIAHPHWRVPDVDKDVARKVIEVDLLAVLWAMQAQIPSMEKRYRETGKPAAIVNLASLAGIAGAPLISAYSAAKHGVVGLTRSAAAEYARRGIRVNAICPAFARTAMVQAGIDASVANDGLSPEQAEAHVVRGVPMRRLGTPEEVAQAILWAGSPENGFMTGQAIAIDGGVTSV
ncbi:SDR family NAD(P)-dependent oxidoreductase [Rhodovulum sp. DZ06]|uniref:SDR family NAD(P)-dependent oxidoreductase n=1 Tax=Rhodovulum sp. DZ06 TaxID=3425126 RepID=UPI003D33380F